MQSSAHYNTCILMTETSNCSVFFVSLVATSKLSLHFEFSKVVRSTQREEEREKDMH